MKAKRYFDILCTTFPGDVNEVVAEEIAALSKLYQLQDELTEECRTKGTYQTTKNGYSTVAPWFSNLMSVRKTMLAQMKDMGYRKEQVGKLDVNTDLLNT